jgi:sugar/nucleoside kinase (ribokinase family)
VNAPTKPAATRPSLAVIGDTAVDYYLMLPPRQSGDEKLTATSSLRLPGGTGANAAASAAALGSQVTLYSMVGTDQLGDWVVQSLTSRGVATTGVRTVPGSTTQATILLDVDDRHVVVDRGVADRLGELDPGQICPAGIVYVTGSGAAIARVAEARNRGRVIAGIEAAMSGDARLASALGKLDLIITNSAGWAMLTEKAIGTVTTVETQGAEGAVIHDPACPDRRIPGIRVGTVDTTGAGDCFAGALCHYLASGLDLAAACQLAVAAAGLSTRAVGAQSALPTDTEVRAAAVQHSRLRDRPGGFT